MGESTTGHRTLTVAVVVAFILCLASSANSQGLDFDSTPADNSLSISDFSFSQSASLSIYDRIPCVFRGEIEEHGSSWTIDPCTICNCKNGTTDCDIVTCPSPRCPDPVTIPGECCPLCPYTMEFFALFNLFKPGTTITEGKTNRFRLDAEVEIFKARTSRRIRGENMWKISAWVSSNSDGSGTKYSYQNNILSEKQKAQEFSKVKADYFPPDLRWKFSKLKYYFNAKGKGLCRDFKFFCLNFDMTENPEPKFDLDFTFTVFQEEYFRQTNCVRLGACKVKITGTGSRQGPHTSQSNFSLKITNQSDSALTTINCCCVCFILVLIQINMYAVTCDRNDL